MFLLVFVVLLGTVVTVNSGKPEVEMHSHVFSVRAETVSHRILVCRATGFVSSDIVLNIKKNHCVQTKQEGVETSGVEPHVDKTYQRRDSIVILKSDKSNYSCEVIHAASRFRVEKVWVNSEVETNVKSSGVRRNEDRTFQRRDSVEIKKSDKSDYSCEVIHAASDMKVEKPWDHLPPPPDVDGGNTGVIIGVVVVGVLVLVVVLVVLRRRRILGAAARNKAPLNNTSGSRPSLDRNISSESGGSTSSSAFLL